MKNKIYFFIKTNFFFFLLLTAIIFLLYGKSINFKFTNHDDISLISNNINYLSQWKNIPSLFTTSVYISKNYFYYRPILSLSFSIESILFYNNTKIYHFTNIILFVLSLYLMYVFLLKLNLNKAILRLLIILVSVHPILTSSVVWIPARNDTLLAIFVFLSFIFFIRYLQSNSIKNLIFYVLFFAIALFTKESAIFLIFLYVLFIYCFDYKFNKKNILINVLIFIPILIIYFYFRHISVETININEHLIYLKDYLNNIVYGYVFFIYKIFCFFVMPVMADTYNINNNCLLVIYVFCCLIIYFICVKNIVSLKKIIFCVSWFFLWLLPTFLFLKHNYLLFPHRSLIPLAIVIFIICNLLESVFFKYRKIFIIVYVFLFGILFVNSVLQLNKYSTLELYINNSIKYAFENPIVQNILVQEKIYIDNLDEALSIVNKLIRKYPDDISAKLNLAKIFYKQGKIKESIELYKEISNMSKENKYTCYKELSKIYMEQNEFDEALFYGQQAYILKPYSVEVSENLAVIYAKFCYYKDAINILTYLLSFDKKNVQYMYNLSLLYKEEGDLYKALEYAKLAVKKEPYVDEYKMYFQKLANEKNNI